MKECMASPVSTLAPVLTSCPVLVVVRASSVGWDSVHFPVRRRSSSGGVASSFIFSQYDGPAGDGCEESDILGVGKLLWKLDLLLRNEFEMNIPKSRNIHLQLEVN